MLKNDGNLLLKIEAQEKIIANLEKEVKICRDSIARLVSGRNERDKRITELELGLGDIDFVASKAAKSISKMAEEMERNRLK